MNDKREFRGVWVPSEVWLDARLTAIEKMILVEIDSLDGEEGCYASNQYLAEFCQCSQAKVSAAISKLRKLGYVESASFDGRKRILHSCLQFSKRQPSKIYKADSEKIEQIILVENTSEDTSKLDIPFDDICAYLNQKSGKSFRPTTKQTRRYISARWSEGFRLDDFKTVIDNMTGRWLGTEWDRFIRPETLFGTKFEGYLNIATERKHDEMRGYFENLDF